MEGKVLVNLTIGTPKEAREMARWAEVRGAGHLNGVIMTSSMIEAIKRSPIKGSNGLNR
ncbi:hypothetical protein [Paenibacillus lautus]|uniref:hypothetical protein n=1 Tax=Paenibacillus lautus TaxID=1401 RepID=UPI0013E358CE|nr:hypothetical protein [Paenibacillus lautus]